LKVYENLVNTLLKMCELILPIVHLLGLHDGLILQTSLQRLKIHSSMSCYIYTEMSRTLVF